MLLTFKMDITKIKGKQKDIINELSWHVEKVYNTLLHEIKTNKRNIDLRKSINILSSKIYTEYRHENWHSKCLHSHTLQQTILNVIQNYKSYVGLNKMYEENNNCLKGNPRLPRYKHEKDTKEIVFTKYAIENKCNKIILGDLKGIKEEMDYNKEFVQLPLQILVQKIEYKARLKGIEVIKISEKYTSGVSAIDDEEITKENYNPKRRIRRGLFVTNEGKKINADINGSLNILRKYITNYIPNLEIVMDKGREQRPIKKRVA